MALKKRKQFQHAFKDAVEAINIKSGNLISFFDDGCRKDGEPNPGRMHMLKKLGMRDDDGDPVFFFPGNAFPDLCVRCDERANQAHTQIQIVGRLGKSPCMNPTKEYKTLGEKAAFNKKQHEAAERAAELDRSKGIYGMLPPGIQHQLNQLRAMESARDDATAMKSVRPTGGQS